MIRIDLLKKQIELSRELYNKPEWNNEGMKKLIDNYQTILEACMSDKTTVETGTYKGSPVLSIKNEYQDKDGNTKQGNVISFGLRKAKAIVEHFDAIKAFVEANDNNNTQQIDLSKLTPEQQALVSSFIQK